MPAGAGPLPSGSCLYPTSSLLECWVTLVWKLGFQLILKKFKIGNEKQFYSWQIVFSEAWWIGTKEENPEELQLEFPQNLQDVILIIFFSFEASAYLVLKALSNFHFDREVLNQSSDAWINAFCHKNKLLRLLCSKYSSRIGISFC